MAKSTVKPGKDPSAFGPGDVVMHPAYGVGRVSGESVGHFGGEQLELVHFTFDEGRLVVRVPRAKVVPNGIRRLAGEELVEEALKVVASPATRAAARGITWARRSKELEEKLNSGDPRLVAEVLRDLGRNRDNPDRSYSERRIFEAALDRLAVELAAIQGLKREEVAAKILALMPSTATPAQKAA